MASLLWHLLSILIPCTRPIISIDNEFAVSMAWVCDVRCSKKNPFANNGFACENMYVFYDDGAQAAHHPLQHVSWSCVMQSGQHAEICVFRCTHAKCSQFPLAEWRPAWRCVLCEVHAFCREAIMLEMTNNYDQPDTNNHSSPRRKISIGILVCRTPQSFTLNKCSQTHEK